MRVSRCKNVLLRNDAPYPNHNFTFTLPPPCNSNDGADNSGSASPVSSAHLSPYPPSSRSQSPMPPPLPAAPPVAPPVSCPNPLHDTNRLRDTAVHPQVPASQNSSSSNYLNQYLAKSSNLISYGEQPMMMVPLPPRNVVVPWLKRLNHEIANRDRVSQI